MILKSSAHVPAYNTLNSFMVTEKIERTRWENGEETKADVWDFRCIGRIDIHIVLVDDN